MLWSHSVRYAERRALTHTLHRAVRIGKCSFRGHVYLSLFHPCECRPGRDGGNRLANFGYRGGAKDAWCTVRMGAAVTLCTRDVKEMTRFVRRRASQHWRDEFSGDGLTGDKSARTQCKWQKCTRLHGMDRMAIYQNRSETECNYCALSCANLHNQPHHNLCQWNFADVMRRANPTVHS